MRTFGWLVLVGGTVLVAASCRGGQPEAQPAAAGGPVPVGTIREIMEGIVERQAYVLFDSVAIKVSAEGTEEKQPTTDDDWLAVQHGALNLAEAANLLTTPTRRVAHPEEENTSAAPDELTPAQIQAKIEANRDLWLKHVKELQDVALQAVKVTNARDVQGLWDVGEPIDAACESCHLEFWYPNEKKPPLIP